MGSKPLAEDRCTMPVIQRYVRRLLADSDRQYREWVARDDAGRLSLQENTNAG